jgi:hypothetical protein
VRGRLQAKPSARSGTLRARSSAARSRARRSGSESPSPQRSSARVRAETSTPPTQYRKPSQAPFDGRSASSAASAPTAAAASGDALASTPWPVISTQAMAAKPTSMPTVDAR